VRSALDAAIRQGAPATLLITGHSLGGALATLCAADVAESWARSPVQHRPRIVLHTFGSPRVGDAIFAARLAAHVPTALRFVAGLDIVPSVPLVAMGYAHAGTGVHLPHADAPPAAVAAHLPGVEYERPPGEVAAAAASGLGVVHHLCYDTALDRQLKQRESMA
jgi:alpha-beta hydrolase superfamily lysophospholipase